MATKDEDENEQEEKDEKKPVTFTQEQVNTMMAREKREGKTAGKRSLLADLGFDSEDELKAAVEAGQKTSKKDPENDDETIAAREAAAREKAEAKAEKDAARKERHEARVERAIIKAGMDPDKVTDRIIRLVDADPGADPEDIASAVADLKEEMPALFEKTSKSDDDEDGDADQNGEKDKKDLPNPPPPKVPGSDVPPNPRFPGTSTAKDSALARLRDRHPNVSSND